MKRIPPVTPGSFRFGRRGVSLSEVLMSLGIMSIGIAFIAGIFPLAALRTLRATNLTNATIARYNAEAAIASLDNNGIVRALIHDPDFDGDLREHRGTNYIVDPLGFNEKYLISPAATHFVFGSEDINGNGMLDTGEDLNSDGALNIPPATVTRALPLQFSGGVFNLDAARDRVGLPDTFNEIGQVVAARSNTANTVTVPGELDMATVDPSTGTYRVTLFNERETKSEIRYLAAPAAASATDWTLSLDRNLPTGFGNVGRVIVEVPTTRYTWLLTVRKRFSGLANVDVVVFLNRSFAFEHEQVYEAEFRMFNLDPNDPGGDGDGLPGRPNFDDNGEDRNGNGMLDPGEDFNGNGVLDSNPDDISEIGYPGTDDIPNNRVIIRWPDDDNTENDPFLQRGGYIFDTSNAIWYRMQAVESQTSDGTTITARVSLEEAIKQNNTGDLMNFGVADAGETPGAGGAMTPRGVVAVFPLGLQ